MSMLVFVFGDSVAWGLYDDRGGWVGRLCNGRSRLVYNLGVDGETSEDISKRFIAEARFEGLTRTRLSCSLWEVNDSSHMNGSHRVGLAEYVHNMEGMIDQAREHFTKNIVCVGLAPIDESKTVLFILERTISFYSLDRHEYDLALEKMCNRKNVTYGSLRGLKFHDHLSKDGVHPLSSGHAMIAERVLQVLSRLG